MFIIDHFTIDHFEERWAVIEAPEGGVFSLPRALLPKEASEGDVLKLETAYAEGVSVTIFRLDREETRARLEASRRLLERLRGKDPGGDLEL